MKKEGVNRLVTPSFFISGYWLLAIGYYGAKAPTLAVGYYGAKAPTLAVGFRAGGPLKSY